MSNIQIIGEGSAERMMGIGTIEDVMTQMVNAELQTEFGDRARSDPTQIVITAIGYRDRVRFEVCSWNEETVDNPSAPAQPHLFMIEIESDGENKPLAGKYFTRPCGERVSLAPDEALFFLGLNFRAMAYYNELNRPQKQ